jgi:phage gp45-like
MPTLFDGTELPSFLRVVEGAGASGQDLSLNDYRIRAGRIVSIHHPGSSSNNNKKFFEFDVEVDVGGGVKKVYPRCIMTDMFGGVADFFEWTPRISVGTSENGSKLDTGSRVLILCLNGYSSKALIIAGAKHHGRPPETKNKGHHLAFEFNGMKIDIDNDGALKVVKRGPTNAEGKVIEQDAVKNGSSIQIRQTGDVFIAAGIEENAYVSVQSAENLVWINGKEAVRATSEGNVIIKSAGVLTGDATDSTMMGSTYRSAESIKNEAMMNFLIQISALITSAGASLAAAATVHNIPVAGPIIGVPAIGAAATALSAAGPLIAQLMVQIQNFELRSQTYLSQKNKSD